MTSTWVTLTYKRQRVVNMASGEERISVEVVIFLDISN